jgi:NAD(P)-dependent dehydrogenase (short-subunit alcohol dehydrogenase family)
MNILITGAGKRIGKEIAIEFAKNGANIILHYNTSKKEAIETKNEISKYSKALLIKANLEKPLEIKKLFQSAKKKVGKIHHLVNCASLFENDDILNFNEKSWDKHLNINAKAPAILISNFAKQKFNKSENLTITNILDQRVFKLTPHFFSYTVSKLILFNMTKTSAMRFAPNIRVNAIAPGPVIKNSRQSKSHFKKQYSNTLLKKQVDKKEIFNACKFFIENKSITGQTIAIDSGQSLNWQTKDLINVHE